MKPSEKLTDLACRTAKPGAKPRKLTDGKGLYLFISPSGGKLWRVAYRFEGKQKTLYLGSYPEITLSAARAKLLEVRRLLDEDKDPRQVEKEKHQQSINTFEAVAREWYELKRADWVPRYAETVLHKLEAFLFPVIGDTPIDNVTAPQLLEALRAIEGRGAIESAHRTKQHAGMVFAYAIATGRAERNPARDLTGTLQTPKTKHHAAITEPAEVGELLRRIEGYPGFFIVRQALRFLPHVFVRPGELRHAEWSEFDLDTGLWSLPAAKMKTRDDHIVPLSTQAIAILKETAALTGGGKLVFAGDRGHDCPLSENTLNEGLRRLSYSKEQMTAHGFRAMARTLLDEQLKFRIDYIEHQLAHAVKDPLGRAYNRTKHLKERKAMMQRYSDYLDSLRNGGSK